MSTDNKTQSVIKVAKPVLERLILPLKFQYSQKNDFGKVPDYIVQRKKEAEEAQREYNAYIQVKAIPILKFGTDVKFGTL